jgi:hypothetical protein
MLEPWIIEEIRRREEERRRQERPQLELPVPPMEDEDRGNERKPDEDKTERGVVIIGL